MENNNHNFDVNKLNSFLDAATKSISCDPTCQKNKKIEKLKEKYLNAESNLTLAEPQYEEARQKYYTSVSGKTKYNEMIEEELNEKANLIINTYYDLFSEELNKIKSQIETYNSIVINFNNVADLDKQYKTENKYLFTQIKEESNDVLTNERKTYYEDQEITSLNEYYYYIFYTIYIITVICYSFFLVKYQSTYSLVKKIIIIIAFITLPFYSTLVFGKIIQIIYWLYGFIPTNVYK